MIGRVISLFVLCCLVPLLHADDRMNTRRYQPSFGLLRDTLYVLDSAYLEIRLDRQMIYLHHRDGRVEGYTCSTGNPGIPEGIATRPGIFTVQNKAAKAFSAAFHVNLNYWMGFDGGIGLHGLDSRSYYRYLGRRPSSHGCVRISNETGARLFRKVRVGTVVFVHNGSPARVVRFADPSRIDLVILTSIDEKLLERRLAAVRELRWNDSSLSLPLALAPGRRFAKIPIGAGTRAIVQYPIPIQKESFIPPARTDPRSTHSSPATGAPWLPKPQILTEELLSDLGHEE